MRLIMIILCALIVSGCLTNAQRLKAAKKAVGAVKAYKEYKAEKAEVNEDENTE